ncbi:glycosyltransferase family 39 protein, partial [Candidatus Pelagibacter sp. HIMB1521]|uniref:glycosyltransferase family 39 protein n=1 Tax=Candidatus Pelagibacter sp. HIMB1521 TaxID=3413344 RepID=UPI003F873276
MIKKFKLKLSNFKSSSIYIILISIIFFSYVLFFANIHGDWRHYIDSEILWPYNVLLILSNQRIEFDAYGFFYFFLEYKFFQILNLFEILKTSNIQDLNNGIYFSEKLENLIFAGRWFNLLVIYTTLITAFCIFKNLSKNSVVSFILVLIFMFSPGMVQQLSHARVDILVSTLIFISFFFLIKFSEDKKKLSFILFIIFFLLAIFTKVQSYLFLFALLISSAYFIKHETENLNQNNLKIWISLVLLIFILYCIFYPIIIHRHAKFSIIFLYSQLILLNGYIYYIFRNLKNVLNKNLIFTSITFFTISIFILLIKNLDYMNIHAVRLTFFEPMEIRMYITETNLKGMDVITLDLKKNITYFYLLFNKIFTGFASTSILIFKNLSSNLLLIIL